MSRGAHVEEGGSVIWQYALDLIPDLDRSALRWVVMSCMDIRWMAILVAYIHAHKVNCAEQLFKKQCVSNWVL